MRILGIRFCSVSKEGEQLAAFLRDGIGIPPLYNTSEPASDTEDPKGFEGTIFPAGDSWIEVWPEGPGMPSGVMLQIVVDDAAEWAQQAKENGIDVEGPINAHGECIYFLKAPSGLAVTLQSRLPDDAE